MIMQYSCKIKCYHWTIKGSAGIHWLTCGWLSTGLPGGGAEQRMLTKLMDNTSHLLHNTVESVEQTPLVQTDSTVEQTPLVQHLCSMSIVGVGSFLHRAINVSSWLLGLDLNKKFIRTILHSICIILFYTYALYCVYLFVGAFLCSFCVIRCCDNHFLGIIKSTVCLWCLWCCVEYHTNFVYLVLKKVQ